MIAVRNWNTLPNNCEECPFWNYEQGICNAIFYDEISTNEYECPLIEI